MKNVKIGGGIIQKLLALGALVVLFIFFSIFGNNFFSTDTMMNILNTSYFVGFMAFGVTFVIITGGIDLSIGTVMICAGLIGGVAYSVWLWPIWLALVVAIVVATLFGAANGLLIAKLNLPPFIATLGTQMISMGFGAIVSKVMTMRFPGVTDPDGWFKYVFYKTQDNLPIGAFWMMLFFALAVILLNKTRFGRYTYAIGSNEEATRLSGVKVASWKMWVYTLCGFYAGLASILYAAVYTSFVPSTGNGNELLAIAAVVIGGTSLSGGSGSISGTLIGVLLMSTIKQGLMSMSLQGHEQMFIQGFVVIGAVLLDNYRNRKRA